MKIFNLKHTKKIVPEQGSSNLNSIRAHEVSHVCMHKKKKTPVRVFHTTYCMQILKKFVPKEAYNNFISELSTQSVTCCMHKNPVKVFHNTYCIEI